MSLEVLIAIGMVCSGAGIAAAVGCVVVVWQDRLQRASERRLIASQIASVDLVASDYRKEAEALRSDFRVLSDKVAALSMRK